jgi:2-polyprenyl-3-methyl-5-hydroxy-6-metoxy-1,4-benzoquinol methylase
VCEACWLVQTEDFTKADELFDSDYAYFSGVSTSWLSHCERYVTSMVERFALDPESHVVEVAANDGALLQFFAQRDIPCTGVEPTSRVAAAARNRGLAVIEEFFGKRLAHCLSNSGKAADLIVANNVLAHVPDINDFALGLSIALKPRGVVTCEFPHVVQLVDGNQFDTIYHEHFTHVLAKNGLEVFDVDELPTHGGSLRVYAQRQDTGEQAVTERVTDLLASEHMKGVCTSQFYWEFQRRAERIKNDFLKFLLQAKSENKVVAAYGAAAKGNTLLNYAGVRPDLIRFVADRNVEKQGKYLPGSRIPIVDETVLEKEMPGYVVVLPWNVLDEIREQLGYIAAWGGQLVTVVQGRDGG